MILLHSEGHILKYGLWSFAATDIKHDMEKVYVPSALSYRTVLR